MASTDRAHRTLFSEAQSYGETAMTDFEFSGRTALVTGGSRGIGRACVEILARHGASVAVNFRADADAAQDVVDAVNSIGQQGIAVQADVTDEAQVRSMVEKVEQELGPINLLVNNAGMFHFVSHEEMDLDIWNQTMACNLTGVFLVTWAVKRKMIERGFGRIVNMSSISALRPRPGGSCSRRSMGSLAFTLMMMS